ncbi:MAG: nickel/cobalt transporter (NicO) family protein [Chloroflexota bacterium]|jgi:ABC-type nickel/cobalt efflux system permease component RcnA|nr:nickel/cobalt transporter (NicO) family protein [Chloroflexota bacterium]
MRARRALALVLALLAVVLVPVAVAAHPLGNFTINHYAEIRIEPDRVLLDVVIDKAEIAAFQARQGFDLDGDGSVSDEEIDAGRVSGCADLTEDLVLTVDGTELELRTIEAGLTFPPGVGGLSTMRLVCEFEATLAAPIGAEPTRIAFTDESSPNRLGWREILTRGSGVTIGIVEGELRDETISARLTAYPRELASRPPADKTVVVSATAGGDVLPPLDIPDATPVAGVPASEPPAATPAATPPASAAPGASPGSPDPAPPGSIDASELPEIFRQDLTPLVLLVSLLTAAALGAGHALTPGHGKTIMAAYLVGTRGTPLHALGLGLSVSLSHTIGIVVLAAVVVGASDVLPADVVVRWAPLVAALSIVLIGGWMLAGELRRRRPWASHPHATEHRHDDHGHPHDHDHDHAAEAPDHAAAHDHDSSHSHGGTSHSHVPPPGSPLSWRSLFAMGLAGGLIPSTSALLILLGSIAAGRPVFGFVLVVAFGLGMAAVMSVLGLGIVFARDRLDRLRGLGLGRIPDVVPLVAAVLVFGLGLYLTVGAVRGIAAAV